ncbi:MAG: M50 family metallopeptidase [Chthoniobacteraceae bacterium]|nr:M50 family metallopeptidase [Chthoniobacteraceae bacterium]
MISSSRQHFRLFRAFGITVFLHWSWFLAAAYELDQRSGRYASLGWNVAEYLALFGIVLMHEFGHALACRQVGGTAREIVLWPLGGVAYVAPPQRPGAVLWSIAAGPLVNVVLGIGLTAAVWGVHASAFAISPLAWDWLQQIWSINAVLLVFNLLPVYPLDGGQILRALLWFGMGPVRSLYVATVIGVVGAVGLGVWAFLDESIWTGILAAYILMNSVRGFQAARSFGAWQRS